MKVGVLGPHGTYSEQAARNHFGDAAKLVYFQLITDIAEAVAKGKIDCGIIPVESLREGSVGEALDALAWEDIKVQAEMVLTVTYSLLGIKGARKKNITQVLSHPQAIAQCRDFLRKHLPKAEVMEVSSTARAAERVAKLRQPQMAAIGSSALARLYGLEVMSKNIQTSDLNQTRFFYISKSDGKRTGKDKTSIVFYTAKDKPGILHKILGEFANRGINLTKIESRPSKKALGDYLFFIDLEGHRADPKVKEALNALKNKTAMLKVIGSYQKKF
ncbi:MAG: prephenate dehydratase [Candidatus Hadarchaeota archaeon]